jgi:hypothetical protein
MKSGVREFMLGTFSTPTGSSWAWHWYCYLIWRGNVQKVCSEINSELGKRSFAVPLTVTIHLFTVCMQVVLHKNLCFIEEHYMFRHISAIIRCCQFSISRPNILKSYTQTSPNTFTLRFCLDFSSLVFTVLHFLFILKFIFVFFRSLSPSYSLIIFLSSVCLFRPFFFASPFRPVDHVLDTQTENW